VSGQNYLDSGIRNIKPLSGTTNINMYEVRIPLPNTGFTMVYGAHIFLHAKVMGISKWEHTIYCDTNKTFENNIPPIRITVPVDASLKLDNKY
jgi:hypothetical protein